ncbi:N/A [soil metagenome]|nr:polysaccharide biosynthesis/export family protein [Acidobacteriota bacterium]
MTKSIVTSFSLLFLLSTGAWAQTTGTSTPAPAAGNGATEVASDYRLATGDKLRVEVYKDEQLSQSLQIRPDGKITLPLVGDVIAAGKTSAELRDTLAEELKEYVVNPVVTVIVVETVPQNVYVMGEVNSPGPKPVKGEISILQALAMAGGFKDFARTNRIRVLRSGPDGETSLAFNYNDAVNGRTKVLMVRPGDLIIVP